ncbi:MAG: hypothetical protein ABI629_07035 [bacterium]
MQEESALSASVVIPAAASTAAQRGFFGRVFDHWKRAAHSIGVVQTRFIMLVVYAVVVVPTGALMRLFRDPLHLRPQATNWLPVRQVDRTVESARQQF